jgi:hypothetical protein
MIIEVACSQDFLGMDTSLAPYRVNWLPRLIATGSVSCSLKEHYFKKGRVSCNH